MTALTADKNMPERLGNNRVGDILANVRIFAGALLMRDADGLLKPGATETGAVGAGRADAAVDNTGGADGDVSVPYHAGVFRYANSGGADTVDLSHIGEVCFIVDDQTVAATDDSSARSPAGIVDGIEGGFVWVRFDEALTRAS